MIYGNLRYSLRFSQPQVHRDTPPPFGVWLQGSPICHAATHGTKVKRERLPSDIGLGWTRDMNALALEVIDPQHTVAATCSAVASGSRLRHPFETPLNRTAETGAFDHLSRRLTVVRLPMILARYPLSALGPNAETFSQLCACIGLPLSLVDLAFNVAEPTGLRLHSSPQ